MKMRVVSSADVFAAGRMDARAFLCDPCDDCSHGKDQHFPHSRGRANDKRQTGACTDGGCKCKQYQQTGTRVYSGA